MKYDQDMEEKEAELTLLRQDYEKELKDLQETEEAYLYSTKAFLVLIDGKQLR